MGVSPPLRRGWRRNDCRPGGWSEAPALRRCQRPFLGVGL